MPIYEFECAKCKKVFEELFHSAGRKKKVKCPRCGGGKTRKLFSLFGVKSASGGSGGGHSHSSSGSCSACSRSSCSGCR